MARVTIKELQDQLKERDKTIDWLQGKVHELQKQNENLLDGKDSVSKKDYEVLSKQFHSLQNDYKELKHLYGHEKDKNSILINKCTRLEKGIAELKPRHNVRGAGRKSTLTEEQVNNFKEMRKQGLSYGVIAKQAGFSKAYVHKLTNKHGNI